MDTVRTIKLSGSLAREFGREHKLAVNSPAEAIQALCATRPGFEKFLMEAKDRGLVFTVFSGKENLDEERLTAPAGDDVIRIIPVIAGSKKAGVLNIIVGVVLIAVGALVQAYVFGGNTNPFSSYLYGAGVSMIVGGVIQMLTPVPKNTQREEDDRRSYVFNGPLNVTAQGATVPVTYGEFIVGSVVVSAGISAEDNYVVPNGPGNVGGGSYRGGGSMWGDVMNQVIQ